MGFQLYLQICVSLFISLALILAVQALATQTSERKSNYLKAANDALNVSLSNF